MYVFVFFPNKLFLNREKKTNKSISKNIKHCVEFRVKQNDMLYDISPRVCSDFFESINYG